MQSLYFFDKATLSPLPSEYGICKSVQGRFWPRLLGIASLRLFPPCSELDPQTPTQAAAANLTPANIYHRYSVGPSIRPMCTRCCLTMTHMTQVCSNFRSARVFIIDARPDEIWLSRQSHALSTPLPIQQATTNKVLETIVLKKAQARARIWP